MQKVKQINSKIIFHSDGVQAFGKINVNVASLNTDMYTISAHKIHGPKGVGGLYIKKGTNIKPLIFGGEHEGGLRAGTQNTSGIFGLAKAAESILKVRENNFETVKILHNYLLKKLEEEIPQVVVLTNFENGSPYITVISVPNLKAETLLHLLEEKEIYVGNGSACSSRFAENRVLKNMGIADTKMLGAVRISINEQNSENEIDEFTGALKQIIENYFNKIK